MSAKNEHGLTPQQETFALAVASGKSLSDAFRTAYKTGKWKPQSVNERASVLASNVKVQSRVRALQAIGAEKAGLNAADILEEVRRLAHSDIGGIMHANGRVKLPNELDPVTRASVKTFKIDEYGRIEYQFWDKNAAIDKAMKHLGLYEKDNKQKPADLVAMVRLVPLQADDGTTI